MKKPTDKKKRSFRKPPSKGARSIKKVLRRMRSKISRKPLKIKEMEKTDNFPSADMPTFYGENRMVLLVKDPWWLFTYWEVTDGRRKEVLEMIRSRRFSPEKTVLRVYDVTDTSFAGRHSFFDIELNFIATNWFIDAGIPDRQWAVELGIRHASPQVILVAGGQPLWNASHGDVTMRALERALGSLPPLSTPRA